MRWAERQRNIIDFTLSSLLRKKGKNISLLSVYVLVVFILASVFFFTHSIRKEASILFKDAPEMVIQKMAGGRHELIPLSYMDKIKGVEGVSSVKRRLWGYYYDPINGANYTLMVPEDSHLTSGEIVIGNGVSRSRLAPKGDTIEFRTHNGVIIELEVKETISAESELISSDLVLISEDDFRKLFGNSSAFVTDLTVEVRNPTEVSAVAKRIAHILPDTRQILRVDVLKTYASVFDWRRGIMIAVFLSASFSFLLFAWDKASGLSPEEKNEIGILKAIGWKTSDVLLMKFWEGLVISLSSFLLGILTAYVHVFFASSLLFKPVLKSWEILYPQFKITPFINLSQIAILFFLSVIPYTVATMIPCWRVATVDPDSVMRT